MLILHSVFSTVWVLDSLTEPLTVMYLREGAFFSDVIALCFGSISRGIPT